MAKVTIDGKEIIVEDGLNVIEACEQAGVTIPRFCYHSKLAIAGNCRMCLVEIEKFPKPVASCAQPVSENMVIHTNTPMVKKAREGVMEFMLANHPLDCPICDQAGECDLQDQAMAFGKGESRYKEEKRAVEEKNFGPLVKTEMTRCIHCTRCVRFITDVAGVPEIGALFRGEDMQIQTYIEKAITSELSGNIIDLCPVGALTSKPYAFKARSWELEKTESIDVLDAVGSNIRIDSRGNEVMRILPRINEDINEEWISDKTRFACDGLHLQRLDVPYVRKNGKLTASTWKEALSTIAKKLKKLDTKTEIAAIAGDLVDVESMLMLKKLFKELGSEQIDCRQRNEKLSSKNRCDYVFNTSIVNIEKADFYLIIGSNPRKEATILNTRIKKAHLAGNLKVALLGVEADLTYDYQYLGNNLSILPQIFEGIHPIVEQIKLAKNPMVIIGSQVLSLANGDEIHSLIKNIAQKYSFIREDWNGFNYLPRSAAITGGLDIGFVPGKKAYAVNKVLEKVQKNEIKLLYLLGADEIEFEKIDSVFTVYQGHHGDKAAQLADVILPSSAYTEKNATYVNLEGRAQRTYKAVSAPGEAKDDWKIILELSKLLDIDLKCNTLQDIRVELEKIGPQFKNINMLVENEWKLDDLKDIPTLGIFKYNDFNYFLTDPICRASITMAKCAEIYEKR